MDKEYIKILIESLQKKEKVLTDLYGLSLEQAEVVKEEEPDWDRFTQIVDKKGTLVDSVNSLDEGFETLFERVKEELSLNKDKYVAEITQLKILVKSVTEKGADLEALEHRNKDLIEQSFARSRQKIKQSKIGTQAAVQYYQKMNKINTVDPQFLDKNS